MPIMAAHGRSDARGTARLLASMALSSMGQPRKGETQEVALNNMFRLLQSFRTDVFFGEEPRASEPRGAPEKLTLRPPEEQNVRQVKEALQKAISAAFQDQPKDQALETIERVMRWVAQPSKTAGRPTDIERERTTEFFRELVHQL